MGLLCVYLAMVDSDDEKEFVAYLYKNYKAYLFSVSLSILHNYSDAEDAIHETFVRVIKNLPKIKDADPDKTKSFITVIIRNLCYDIVRKNNHLSFENDYETDERYFSDTVKEAETRLDFETVIKNISKLSPTLKNISTLYFVLQYSVSEICEILGVSEDAVYSAVSRSRKILSEKQQEGDTNDRRHHNSTGA